jgi:hypothetical protein
MKMRNRKRLRMVVKRRVTRHLSDVGISVTTNATVQGNV